MAKSRGLLDTLSYFLDSDQEADLRKKAWEAFNKAREALDKARENARDATIAARRRPHSRKAARRLKEAQGRVRERRRITRETIHTLREIKSPRRRVKKFLGGFQNVDIAGAATRGAAEGGPGGAILGGAGAAALGTATGAAQAFGGVYGTLFAKGIQMFSGLIEAGMKFQDSLYDWAHKTEERTFGYAKASPHMFAVAAQRQFLDMVEDMRRGQVEAPEEEFLNRARSRARREQRLAELNEAQVGRRARLIEHAQQEIRGRIADNLRRSGHGLLATGVNTWGVRHLIDWAAVRGLAEGRGEIGQRLQRELAELRQLQQVQMAQAERDLELDRATEQGANPFSPRGFFDLIRPGPEAPGEATPNSFTEQVFRLGMGGDWATNAGLPDRWGGE